MGSIISRWPLVPLQCWISVLRLLAALFVVGYLLRFLVLIDSRSVILDFVARLVSWLVFWILIVLDDIFMLTVDLKRTYTYLGCVAAQAGINFFFSAFIILYATPQEMSGYFHFQMGGIPMYVLSAIPVVVVWFSSLGLFLITLRPIFAFRSLMPIKHLGKINSKDALSGAISPLSRPHTLSIFGCPRYPPIKTSASLNRFVANLLFRGVRPAETHTYAFARNIFAVAAICILIFRTVAALLHAQNEIGTHVKSGVCDSRASSSHNIGILMEREQSDINITVSASWSNVVGRNYESYGTTNCSVSWSERNLRNRTLELYGCDGAWTDRLGNYNRFQRQWDNRSTWNKMLLYHIEIRPQSSSSGGGRVLGSQMPYIWLLNFNELPSNRSLERVDSVQFYQLPWELLRGAHIEAEAKLITRRFIKSSIMKDIILYTEPDYRILSLYPIAESSVVPLNSSNSEIATATVRTSLTPGIMSLRRQGDVEAGNYSDNDRSGNACDFIEDYRSGSVVDVIGSVGGLFALLQALHVLLFGRPLLWGLTGAKLITPFGLFGKCSSREFKRRLREEYHSASTEDGSEAIRVGKFLRDFVIEFGPVDPDPELHTSQQSASSPRKVVVGDEYMASEIPLMPRDGTMHRNEVDEGRNRTNSNHSHVVD
ncbi:hypothetical protein RSAG8_12702, partial [Rhizoctonia solani AG-8 WAC10335]